MQAKTMKSIMRKKIDEWAGTVTDPAVAEIIKQNAIITGGAIASMLMMENVNDYDVYFRTGEAAFAVAKYYVDKFVADGKNNVPLFLCDKDGKPLTKFNGERFRIMAKSAGVVTDDDSEQKAEYQYFEATDSDGEKSEEYVNGAVEAAIESDKSKNEFNAVWMSSNAITLSDKIQIVIRFFGEPDEIHKNYDFVHCTSYWQSWDGFLYLNPAAMESILSKVLHYQGSLYPICSVIRTRKFIGRGWRITAFMELISLLKKDMHEKQTKEIDQTYLMTLIDRIF